MTDSRLSFRTLTVAVACTVFLAIGIFAFPAKWLPMEYLYAAVQGFANVDTEKTIDPMAVSPAVAFTAGNLVVYRVGTGAAPLDSTATAVFLDEYTSAGTLVQSVALPTTTSGSNRRFTASGSATSEGLLTRSTDGRYLVLAGYDAATGTPSVGSTTSAAVNRVIARIGVDGTIDTTTALTDAASGNSPRGVAATDGSGYWLTGGAGGVRYAAAGGTTSTQLSTTVANIRGVGIFGSQLYISTSSGSTVRVGSVGTGTPTATGNTISNLTGYSTSGSPHGFLFADLSAAVAGVDTLYVVDDSSDQIQKYSLTGGSWDTRGAVAAVDVRGLAASISGSAVTLFATSGGTTGGGTLFRFIDSTGYDGTISGSATSLASAATNTAFRGVALAPVQPAAPAIQVTGGPVSFGNQGVNSTSVSQSVTVTNTGSADLVLGTPTFATGTQFAFTSDPNGTVLAPTGSTTISFTFTPTSTGAKNDTVTITSNASGPAPTVSLTGTGIQPGVFTFDPQSYSPGEGGTATVTVTRTGGSDGAVSVDFAATAGTPPATAGASCAFGTGVDYLTVSGTLNFANGETSKTFDVVTCNDGLFEGTETVNFSLSNAQGGAAIGGTSTATVNILDDPIDFQPTIQFSMTDFDFGEGGSATVQVTRMFSPEHELTVNYAALVGGGSNPATPGTCSNFSGHDFVPTSGTLTFLPGEDTKTFDVTLCEDGLFEPTESISIALNTVSAPGVLSTPNTGRINITENDAAPSVEFSTAASSVGENAGTKTFTVNRTGATENSFSVNFATANGLAIAGPCGSGGDYVSNSGILNFAGGDPSQTFNVTICDDTEVDPNESFTATLSGPTAGALIGTNNSETVTITDNEPRTLVVDRLDDSVSADECTASANDCSLRRAIETANDGDTIAFDPTVFNLTSVAPQAQTIVLVGEIAITSDITITGPGASVLSVDAGPGTNRIFNVAAGTTVSMSGVTLTGGSLPASSGGAILAGSGSNLSLTGVTVTGNTAFVGGAIVAYNVLNITNSVITGNSAPGGGGAISLVELGSLTLTNSTVSDNTGNIVAGAIWASFEDGIPKVNVSGSTFSNNCAGSRATALDPCPATGAGGAIFFQGTGIPDSFSITNSTFLNNLGSPGGGLYYTNSSVGAVVGSTFSNSIVHSEAGFTASQLTLRNSILSGCTLTNVGGIVNGGFNIDTGTSCQFGSAGNSQSSTDPMLGPLQNNGGPTHTMALLPGSPAIDAGSAFGLTTDQRGIPRPVDRPGIPNAADASDIGAYEMLAPTAASVSISGRVIDPYGRGIRGAMVMVQGMDGVARTVYTNSLGYYRIDELPVGESFVVTVSARRYAFAAPTQFVNLADSINDLNFTASP